VSMSNPTNRVEIITSVQRRRRWTAPEKVRMVEETFEPGMTVSLVARRHGVAQTSCSPGVGWWRKAA
jgi:transposase